MSEPLCDADMEALDDLPSELVQIALAELRILRAAVATLTQSNADAARNFDVLAIMLDSWAEESTKYGWSTHQVQANRAQADLCRLYAGRLQRATGEGR